MSAPVGVSSLLAIAMVRRLLLELEVSEDEDPHRLLNAPIEIWVFRPMAEFDGKDAHAGAGSVRWRCRRALVAQEMVALRKAPTHLGRAPARFE